MTSDVSASTMWRMRKASSHSPLRRKNHFLLALLFSFWLSPNSADAQNYGNLVEVCNKGDIDLSYIYFATNSSLFGGEQAKIAGWYTIEPGDCGNVNPTGFDTVAVGFLQVNDNGVRGNSVYILEDATNVGSTEWAPSVICAPTNDALSYKNGLGVVREKYTPPCQEGFAEFKMSFGVIPNDVYPTYNLTPRGDINLLAWPAVSARQATAPSKSEPETSNLEVAARIMIGAAQGLEDGKVRKLNKACRSSSLVWVFNFSNEGPAQACECFSRQIVRGEPSGFVTDLIARIDAGADFDDETEKIPEQNLERYLKSCISPP